MIAHNERVLKSIATDLKQLRCTANLPSEVQALLASVAVKRKFKANEYVWEIGDPGEFLAIVQSGFVEVARYSSSDEEMAMGVFGPSDVIGISAVMKKTVYPGSARIIAPGSELIKLYLRPILQRKDPIIAEVHTWIREMMLLHEQVLRDKIDILNAGSVESRVFELFNHLIRRFGKHESHLRHFIPIQLTRAQVGKLTDVRVETIIRLISKWQKQNLVRWAKDGILIENLPLLEKSLTRNRRLK